MTSLPICIETGWVGRHLMNGGVSHQFVESFHRMAHELGIEIRTPNLERVVRQGHAELFNNQGHADASLVVLAEELANDEHEATILTGERNLVRWCNMNNVPVERFQFPRD